MKIAIIQTEITWENPTENLKKFQKKIDAISFAVDLIVLPEMFTTAFSMNAEEFAETMNGKTVRWMKMVASTKNCAITGSLIISENKLFYNRLLFVYPSGKILHYNKRHLFSLAGEDEIYTKGNKKLIVDFKGFSICMQICYDLRFPVFSRNIENYDLLIYVANWPESRINAWNILLRARAIENICYAIGVNRIGDDANKNHYSGHSQAVDFLGEYVLEPQILEGSFVVEINKQIILDARKKLNFLNDRDLFELID